MKFFVESYAEQVDLSRSLKPDDSFFSVETRNLLNVQLSNVGEMHFFTFFYIFLFYFFFFFFILFLYRC